MCCAGRSPTDPTLSSRVRASTGRWARAAAVPVLLAALLTGPIASLPAQAVDLSLKTIRVGNLSRAYFSERNAVG